MSSSRAGGGRSEKKRIARLPGRPGGLTIHHSYRWWLTHSARPRKMKFVTTSWNVAERAQWRLRSTIERSEWACLPGLALLWKWALP